jgi:hypothetical protein
MHKIMSQARIDSLRIMLGLQLFLIHADKLFAFARIFTETIVSDAINPGGKPRLTAKASNVLVRAKKGFLCEVIGQGKVCPGELSKEATHTGLMPAHEFAEGVLIVLGKNSRDKVRIG